MEMGFTKSANGLHMGSRSCGTMEDESLASVGIVREARVMRQEEPECDARIGPLDWLKTVPFEADAASDRLGWAGLEAARYREGPPRS